MANDKWSGINPWLGLAPYTEGTPLYGRTQESAILSEIIKDNIATIVYGKSGIGKSSLLSAGISPMLRSEQYIPVPLRLVHNTEISYVEQIEARIREIVDCKDELPDNVPNLGLWDFFHRHTFTKDGVSCRPVIILDQFEEIYTLTDVEHKPEIIALFTELASLLNDIKPDAVLKAESSSIEKPVDSSSNDADFSFELSTESSFAYNETVSFRFVICLREDKFYLLERNSANIPSIKTNRYNLQALSPDSAFDVITCPRPELFTTEEATAIVDKLADMGDEGIRTVDPAILSLFLYKYFEKKGEANYDNIFADYYHEATKGIKDKSLAFLEDHLLTLGGYRNQIPIDDALSSGVPQSEIDSLLKQIILRSEKRKSIDYIEFSHDRLCAEAKKNRDERTVVMQRKLYIRRLFWALSIFVGFSVLLSLYIIQIFKINNKLEIQKESIAIQNENLRRQKDSLQIINTKNILLSDSISRQYITLFKNRDSIITQQRIIKKAYQYIDEQNLLLKMAYEEVSLSKDSLQMAYAEAENYKKALEEVIRRKKEEMEEKDRESAIIIVGRSSKDTLSNNSIHYRSDQSSVDVLTTTVRINANGSCKTSFLCRGRKELAVVSESGGRITLKIHVTNNSGLDVWYNDTSNIKEGEQSRKMAFDTPRDKRNKVELEIINCVNKDISCVIISN